MEGNRKRRGGFMKGKFMPFYRAAKPAASPTLQYSSKVMKPSQASPAAASVGFIVQPKQKVSFMVSGGDDSVDIRASTFISSVRERFNLEHGTLEPLKCQETQ